MSRAKTSLAVLALALTFVPACASAPDPKKEEQAKINAAVEDALKPATQEEIDAANNAGILDIGMANVVGANTSVTPAGSVP